MGARGSEEKAGDGAREEGLGGLVWFAVGLRWVTDAKIEVGCPQRAPASRSPARAHSWREGGPVVGCKAYR